jgi:hypothetical protein
VAWILAGLGLLVVAAGVVLLIRRRHLNKRARFAGDAQPKPEPGDGVEPGDRVEPGDGVEPAAADLAGPEAGQPEVALPKPTTAEPAEPTAAEPAEPDEDGPTLR